MANEYVKAGEKRKLASLGERFASFLLDGIFLTIINLPMYFVYLYFTIDIMFNSLDNPFILYSFPYLWYMIAYIAGTYIVSILYFTFTLGSKKQSTLGMRILHMRAIRTDGTDLTYGRAFMRWLGMVISGIAIYLGYIWILIDKNRQGWHDKIADVYIIKK